MNPRRERFRQAMARFEPTADPVGAISDGLYVEPPTSFATRTFMVLEVRPRSSHLVAGPSGTGKTTELRVLQQRLRASDEVTPIFIDAGPGFFPSPGSLISELARLVKETASGFSLPDPSRVVHQPHLLAELPKPPLLLLDSFDRASTKVFEACYAHDLARLNGIVAVVVVAPHAVLYGAARDTVERFDRFSPQATADPASGGAMHAFLRRIIRQRAAEDLFPDDSCTPLVEASGGILRDLIALAQLALEEAYVAGHDRVEPTDVARAIDTFGRKHIIGLDSEEVALLQRVRKTGNFVRVNDRDTSLLVTRRVLEYADEAGGASRYVVHPTLVPLLDQLGDP